MKRKAAKWRLDNIRGAWVKKEDLPRKAPVVGYVRVVPDEKGRHAWGILGIAQRMYDGQMVHRPSGHAATVKEAIIKATEALAEQGWKHAA